jgi:hypothetical protein
MLLAVQFQFKKGSEVDLDQFLDDLAGISEHKERVKLWESDANSNKKTLLLLTCIDLRYPSVIHAKMEPRFHKLYDTVSLAGAGLSPIIDFGPDRKPHWQQTFLEHVSISYELHNISRVLVMDHRDCGAFQKFGLLDPSDTDTEREKQVHVEQALRLQSLLKGEFPMLDFNYLLLPTVPHHYTREMKETPAIEVDALA